MELLNFQSIINIGAVLFAVVYFVQQLRGGSSKAKDDLIATLNQQLQGQLAINSSLQAQAKSMQEQISDLKLEVGKLQGINESNDKKIQENLTIIANRNPDLEKTLTSIGLVIPAVLPFMDKVEQWHQDLRVTLDKIEADVSIKGGVVS